MVETLQKSISQQAHLINKFSAGETLVEIEIYLLAKSNVEIMKEGLKEAIKFEIYWEENYEKPYREELKEQAEEFEAERIAIFGED